jgi:putative DNA primase/helicase
MMHSEFREAMTRERVDFRGEIIADGAIHRFASGGKGNEAAWYVFYGMAGAFGDWSRNIRAKWSVSNGHLSYEDKKKLSRQIEEARKATEEETCATHRGGGLKALAKWTPLLETGQSPYLQTKKVETFGVRFSQNSIVVPLRDIAGKLWSLQWIHADGTKRFLAGGRKKGCFHHMGTFEEGKPIYVTEGYATGASVYMTTHQTTVIAFDAGNLDPVIEALKRKYPHSPIIVAGDDDSWNETNVGRQKAEQAGHKHGCSLVFPQFKNVTSKPTDFNDLHVLEGLEAVKSQLEHAQSFPPVDADPQPVNSSLLPVLSFTLDMLPESLQPWVKDITYRKQCPMDFVAIPAILMFASLIGARCSISPYERDNWKVVPNLWGGILGEPGTMKSPVCSEVLFPFKYLEAKAKEEYTSKKVKFEAEKIIFLEAKNALERKAKEIVDQKDEKVNKQTALATITEELANLLKNEPLEPAYIRYKVSDTTVEKMQEILSQNPQGVLVYRDELMGFLESWEKKGHESDRSFYLEAWNGDQPYTSDRIGRGTVLAENICVSILGTTQPDKILPYLHKAIKKAANDGLLQRFQLLVYPDNLMWKVVDEYEDLIAKQRVFDICKTIVTMKFTDYGAEVSEPLYEGQYNIPFFRFSSEAQSFFHNWVGNSQQQPNSNNHEIIGQHLSKYKSLMPSLALIFHIVDIADGQKGKDVSFSSVQKAALWCDYLESHARRIYGMVLDTTFDPKPSPSKSDELLAWMRKQSNHTNQPLKRRFIMRHSKFRSSKELDPLLSDLIQMDRIQEGPQGTFCVVLEASLNR